MKKLAIILAVLVGFLIASSAAAYQLRIFWEPPLLAPDSIAPGERREETARFLVRFATIPKVTELRVEVSDELAPYVVESALVFDDGVNKLKKGDSAEVVVTLTAPPDTPTGVIDGSIDLVRQKKKRLWPVVFAKRLPVQLTISPIPLPPDPGKEGEATLEGIDADNDGIRDDLQRYIVLTYPDDTPSHQNTRNALGQYARAAQQTLVDAEDKEMSRGNSENTRSSLDCLWYIHGGIDEASRVRVMATAQLLNTRERIFAENAYNGQLSGQVTRSTPFDERASKCDFVIAE